MTKQSQSALLLFFASLSVLAFGQDIPAVTSSQPSLGFQLPNLPGTLTYALSATESVQTNYYGGSGVASSTFVSGDLAFITRSEKHPFSMVLTSGYGYVNTGGFSDPFLDLSLSQVYKSGQWSAIVSDSINYLPESPSGSLSGLAGLGTLGVPPPLSGADPGGAILTYYGQRVANSVTATLQRNLTASTAIEGTGAYSIEKFTGDAPGLDSHDFSVGGGLNHRINALSSVGGSYNYAEFSYPSEQFSFITQSVVATYSRSLTRRLHADLSAGPERTSASGVGVVLGGVPATISLQASASLSYTNLHSSVSLSYVRGVQAGSGVVAGSNSDSITAGYNRSISALTQIALNGSYSHHSSIPALNLGTFSTDSVVAGAQATRSLGRSFSAYVSYTAEDQSVQNPASTINAFNGLSQVIAVGITYSPRAKQFGHS